MGPQRTGAGGVSARCRGRRFSGADHAGRGGAGGALSADRDHHAQPRTDLTGGGYSARHAHHRRGRRRARQAGAGDRSGGKADALLVDALVQCADYGEIATAYRQTRLTSTPIIEMGALLAQGGRLRSEPQHITIADLTGLAIQDLQIAKGVGGNIKGAAAPHFISR